MIQPKTVVALLSGLLLASTVLGSQSEAQLVEPPSSEKSTISLRFAAVHGATAQGSELPEDLQELQGGVESALEQWDLEADFSELRRVFQLADLEEVSRWSSTATRPGGQISTRLSSRWQLDLSYTIDAESMVDARVELSENGTVVSAPRLKSVLGERMIVSTAHRDGTFLFIFFEVEESN